MIQPIGYFKLWRELFTKPIWLNSTPEQKTIFVTLLAMANFSEKEWEWKGEKFKADRGEFVTSLDSIARNCGKGITIQNVRTALKRFENLGFITNESTKTGRLITIVNWEVYQSSDDESNKEDNKDLTKSQQRPNKDLTPREEGKKDKKDIYISVKHLSLTEDEYNKLITTYGKRSVDNKIEYMKDYPKLKNYTSMYRTLNNWLKRDVDKIVPLGVPDVNPTPSKRQTVSLLERVKAQEEAERRKEGQGGT